MFLPFLLRQSWKDAVKWEQKECYGENWGEGRDHDECMKEGIHSFPTVRFFSALAVW